jgi:hypothetical protein
MPFVVSFKKMDPNLGAIIIGAELTQSGTDIIGANYAYVAGDRGSTP